ncbi:hypothetical protein NXX42_16550 [Bacteroides thetaiotaomicron]|nr:hypothetical protein [Bacteroides thetaiotaomicron]
MVTPGLKANVKFSWDAYNAHTLNRIVTPSTYYATGRDEEGNLDFVRSTEGSDYMKLTRTNSGTRTINFEASANYGRLFGEKHRVGALFLFSMRNYTDNFPGNYVDAFAHKNIGIAGRATYSYYDRYFAEFNFGYNGSENFAPDKRFGFFPSFAIGYMLSNESFWDPLRSTIHLLKIKGSYGEIGNDQIGGNRRFAFNSTMKEGQYGYIFGTNPGSGSIVGISTGIPGNLNVSWEKAQKRM